MKVRTLLPDALIGVGAFAGAAVWLFLFECKVISSVSVALPSISCVGATLGYILGVTLEHRGLEPTTYILLRRSFRVLFPTAALLLVILGILIKDRSTLYWGLFCLIVAFVPESLGSSLLAAGLLTVATIFGVAAYLTLRESIWIILATASALAAIASIYIHRHPEEAKQALDRL